jgi:cytochrome c-type biogenesis protein CcsB
MSSGTREHDMESGMKTSNRNPIAVRILSILAAGLLLALLAPGARAASDFRLSVGSEFLGALKLEEFRLVAVQEGGRIKTFDSLAREKLKYVNASSEADAIDPVARYLDMMLVPQHWIGTPVIHIDKRVVREQIVNHLRTMVPPGQRAGPIADPELERILDEGLVSIEFVDHPQVQQVLSMMERDLRQTAKQVQEIRTGRGLADHRMLRAMWKVIPPPGGDDVDPWHSVDALTRGAMPNDSVHAGMMGAGGGGIPGLDGAIAQDIREAWQSLQQAWRFQDAEQANRAMATLSSSFAQVEPSLYPGESRRAWEHWYYKYKKLTPGWIVYFFSLPFLLMAFLYGFRWARVTGLLLFGAGFVIHTVSIGLRWYLAGRIPNANMFEAIIASAWFGGLLAIAMEYLLRRRRMKNLPALGAGFYAMLGMMFGNFMTVKLNSDITTVMPVLDRTIWLYIHTNMIIISYALIFFAAVTAVIYLGCRWAAPFAPRLLGSDWGPSAFAIGGASQLILRRDDRDEPPPASLSAAAAADPGGPANQGLARTLDGATMVFLEVAFITLWLGTILGAVWADVSWGRPWGWDPKEVFALNTWLVFLVLVHVRFKVREKALWTAWLAVIGCAVMLFNWVAVNFVIVGLHSYA